MSRRFSAALFDRDGTLVADVPYNGDPDRVELLPGARAAVERLRGAAIAVGVVTNQSGIGRGLLARRQVEAVNRRIDALLGGLDIWMICPHRADEGCTCRKPRPGLILRAASGLGTTAGRCAVIGDIGADVDAARSAGAYPVLVPNGRTRREEIETAPQVAADLASAVELVLGGW